MTSVLRLLTILATWCILARAAPTGDNQRLRLRVIRHQPCTNKIHSNERIRFSSIANAPLVSDDQRGEGCYSINGPVQIRKAISGDVQIYVQVKSGTKAPLEKCSKPDKHGCGGVGSCVYCDACTAAKQVKKSTASEVTVEKGGKSLDCDSGLSAGNYTDIRISFCMPSKQQFLDAEGIDEDIWNQNGGGGHTFFMSIYVFNKPVNQLSSSDLQAIATDDSDQTIGCHRLVGTVYEAGQS